MTEVCWRLKKGQQVCWSDVLVHVRGTLRKGALMALWLVVAIEADSLMNVMWVYYSSVTKTNTLKSNLWLSFGFQSLWLLRSHQVGTPIMINGRLFYILLLFDDKAISTWRMFSNKCLLCLTFWLLWKRPFHNQGLIHFRSLFVLAKKSSVSFGLICL